MMETKLNNMGLSSAVSMTNAAGIDAGDHYATALDWATLGYLAIQHECVKTIVNTSPWIVERIQPEGTSLDFFAVEGEQGDGEISIFEAFNAGWVNAVKGSYGAAVGIKPGLTPGGWNTGVSASDPFGTGHSSASSFGSRRTDVPVEGVVSGSSSKLNADLLKLAGSYCDDGMPPDDFAPTPDPGPQPWGTLTAIPPCPEEDPQGMTFNLIDEQATDPGRVVQFDLMRRTHIDPKIETRLMVRRESEVALEMGEIVDYGIAPHAGNDGVRIRNVSSGPAMLKVQWDGAVFSVSLAPGDEFVLAGVSTASPSFDWWIESLGREPATLAVSELSYTYEPTLGTGFPLPDSHSVLLTRDGDLQAETVSVYVRGVDDDCGPDLLDLVARADDGVPTAVEEGGGFLPPAPATFQLLPNYPNPFNPTTTVRFDLPRPARVDLAIYDLRGRLVKTFARGQEYAAGRHQMEWNGTDDGGRRVASGVYTLRLVSEGMEKVQRMTLLK